MAKKPATLAEIDLSAAFPDAPDLLGDRQIMSEIYKESKFIPQAIGEDSSNKLAGADSPIYFNFTDITQTLIMRRQPNSPIYLLPGDCVIGVEFEKYTGLYGGPLNRTTFEDAEKVFKRGEVVCKSRRDAAYYEARSTMKGPIAARAKLVKLPNPANLAENMTG